MKVAVIGSGMSGLAAAWYLSKHHRVTLCERGPHIGMDAHSVEVDRGQGSVYLNAPMRVFFEGYYPTLSQLYRDIEVAYEPIKYSGSFSQRGSRPFFQYKNHWLGSYTLPFLTGRSARSPAAWRLGLELTQFLRQARKRSGENLPDSLTIDDYLRQNHYSQRLAEGFLYPAFAGICTCSYDQVKAYPASIILDYLGSDLTWSRVNRLTHGVRDVAQRLSAVAATVRCNLNLKTLAAHDHGVEISDGDGYRETFDHVVVATQANHAVQLLPQSMSAERDVLAQFDYRQSRLLIHEDPRLAPAQQRDWAPVNFVLCAEHDKPMASIWMNSIYPQLGQRRQVFETWNPFEDVDAQHTLIDAAVDRPLVTPRSLAAIARLEQLQQQPERNVWFCGSYARRGIPLLESAVASAKGVADKLAPTSAALIPRPTTPTAPELQPSLAERH